MKKKLVGITTVLVLLGIAGIAQATLTTIGTASYGGADYNLIYDDDDTGYSSGGLVWLDYTHSYDNWANQVNWASGLGSSLTVTLNSGYTTDIDWTTGWRLPDTVDGLYALGYEGDPDNDGDYNYTVGCNIANSEMGHLYYTELGNTGSMNTDGIPNWNIPLPAPDYWLENTGDFENLIPFYYWSGTEYADSPYSSWRFDMSAGYQGITVKGANHYGLAVRSGHVSAATPVPGPATMLLFGTGLAGFAALKRRKKWNRV